MNLKSQIEAVKNTLYFIVLVVVLTTLLKVVHAIATFWSTY